MSKKEPRRLAFAIGAAGLGNSTRCLPLIQAALRQGLSVRVFAGEPACSFLRERLGLRAASVQEISAIRFPEGRKLSLARTGFAFPGISWQLAGNGLGLFRALRSFRPDALVADSEYLSPVIARVLGIQVIAINHASQSLEEWRRSPATERAGLRASFHLLEGLENLYFSKVARKILVPSILPGPDAKASSSRYVRVRPFASDLPRSRPKENGSKRGLLILAGGTGMGDFSALRAAGRHLDRWESLLCVGRVKALPGLPRAQLLGIVPDVVPYLRQADRVIAQCGLSTLSQLIWAGVPALLMPIPGHAEQAMNARIAERLGVGMVLGPGSDFASVLRRFENGLPAMTRKLRETRKRLSKRPSAWAALSELLV